MVVSGPVRVAIASLAYITVANASASTRGPSTQVMDTAAKSVAQVIANQCTEDARTGSGFLWESPTQLVTALHVVARCKQIDVYFAGQPYISATFVRALPGADLALLELTKPVELTPLKTSVSTPTTNDKLQALGYGYGVPTLDSTAVTVKFGSAILGDMVPDKVRATLERSGSPRLDTAILRLDGSLVPGLSGAPVIDDTGEVAGIGSGGLENGLANVSWAIQARYLKQLATAPPPGDLPPPANGPLFASPSQGGRSRQIQCGDFSFAFTKSRTIGELLGSADDIPGFFHIAQTTGLNYDQLQAIELDVYAEQSSGGSVALPKGAELKRRKGGCIATIADGLELTLVSTRVADLEAVQRASSQFEIDLDKHGLWWRADPNFTYPVPITRRDGLVVRRKNFLGFMSNTSMMPSADLFETIMTRGTVFVGISLSNTHFDRQLYQQCLMQSDTPACAVTNQQYAAWVASVLGLQMSTFPPR